jgi:tetratricopeptide (TPR) repeat protein
MGAKIEAERRAKGVYPMKEIITPSVTDSQNAFSTYMNDATERLRHDMEHPNEPKRIKAGEQVQILEGKVSVSGQVAVMAINGLLTKDIFDANPTNDFFVEESFPLDWMFPYLSPFGIIMKINRQPVPEFTQEMINKDHEFWSKYSERFTGNWITYDTPVKDICDFAERVYHRRDYKGFKGSPMFVRDDNAQKSFSKLRSALGGLYMFRYNSAKTQPERDRVLKEAEFAFKQAFSFCPYSPEAVYKYVSLLVNLNKVDDAIRVAQTCIIFDPENPAMQQLLGNLEDIKRGPGGVAAAPAQGNLTAAEAQYRTNPGDLNIAFQLASLYLSMQRTQEAYAVFEQLSSRPDANAQTLLSVANAYSQLNNLNGLEATLGRLAKLMPENPEAWYDLARAQAMLHKNPEALANLRKAVALSNKRKAADPKAKDLAADAQVNQSFQVLRGMPEFSKVLQQQEP